MTYLLDTNAVIALLRNNPPAVRARWRKLVKVRSTRFAVSSIALFELHFGVALSAHPEENADRLRVFFSGDVSILDFSASDAAIAGTIRAHLERRGARIGAYDLLVAAQALRADATLVTANTSEFSRVPKLRWQDWS